MTSSQHLWLSIERGIARIELSDPRTGNRIDHRMAGALRAAAETVAADASVRAVLIIARGRDFCAGGVELQAAAVGFDEFRVAAAVARIPQPVVAALHGAVFDQGLELALAADIRLAGRDTSFAMRQVVRGGMPFDGGTQRLPRAVGRGLASDMLLTARELTAEEGQAAGLVTRVVENRRLNALALDVVEGIAARGSVASRYAKEAVLRGVEMPIDDGLRLEADLSLLLFGDAERAEGLSAFVERRRPGYAR